jgi:hypothetical protein
MLPSVPHGSACGVAQLHLAVVTNAMHSSLMQYMMNMAE